MPYRIAGICLSSDNYSSDPFSKGSLAFETRMDRLLDSEGGPVCIIQGMLRLNRPMKWRKSSLLTLTTSPEDGRRTLSKNPDKILCIEMGAIVLISTDSNFPLLAINYPVKVDRGNRQNVIAIAILAAILEIRIYRPSNSPAIFRTMQRLFLLKD